MQHQFRWIGGKEGRKLKVVTNSIRILLLASSFLSSVTAQDLHKCVEVVNEAFLRAEYTEVIRRAESCVTQLISSARKEQLTLQAAGRTLPTGNITQFDRHRIFRNVSLNSVATALFLKGAASERLLKESGDKKYGAVAENAYQMLCSCYSLGRKWTTNGFFTSPCEDAKLKLHKSGSMQSVACQ